MGFLCTLVGCKIFRTVVNSNKYYECVSVALVIWHANRMRRVILSSMASLALPYFSTLSHKGTICGEGDLLNITSLF